MRERVRENECLLLIIFPALTMRKSHKYINTQKRFSEKAKLELLNNLITFTVNN